MPLSTTKLHKDFGAEILNFKISSATTVEEAQEVRALTETFGFVLLRDQDLSESAMVNFSEKLGGAYKFIPVQGQSKEFIYKVTNLDDDGSILPLDDVRMRSNVANELWHTDTTYARPRTALSMLYAIQVVPEGGETQFCDTRCGYEALSAEEQKSLEGLVTMHSIIHSRALTGFHDWSDEQRDLLKPIARPLVELQQRTGRRSLCIASHVESIEPLSADQANLLLKRLIDISTRPEAVYTHKWKPKDLLIWDNRCTMHRARPYEYTKYPRDYRTARVTDFEDVS